MASAAELHSDTLSSRSAAKPNDAPSANNDDGVGAKLNEILQSEIGVAAMLVRLKQSISSCKDFAAFLKRRAMLEEEQAQGIRKLCKSTTESLRRPDSRQESYGHQFEGMARLHDRLADNGLEFALALHQMHDEMVELGNNMERSRKNWKQIGASAERKTQDAEQFVEKAKAKYNSCAEEYDRVKTGARPTKTFGFKAARSGSQHEEELHRRTQVAAADYENKVQIANANRQEVAATVRPQAVGALRTLVRECDAGLTAYLQKYAELNEKLILRNALTINPVSEPNIETRRLRDIVGVIDNDKDFQLFLLQFSAKMPLPPKEPELKFELHPCMAPQQQPPQPHSQPLASQHPSQHPQHHSQHHPQHHLQQQLPLPTQHSSQYVQHPQQFQQQKYPQQHPQHPQKLPDTQQYSIAPTPLQQGIQGSIRHLVGNDNGSRRDSIPLTSPGMAPRDARGAMVPPLETHGFGTVIQQPVILPTAPQPGQTSMLHSDSQPSLNPRALRPVFGVSLEDLMARDDILIPKVVHECIQAVDLYGLDVEGIYRLSGDKKLVDQIKIMFDNDENLDFRRPDAFFHDVNSVASVLKQFLMELPDPVITSDLYGQFIGASKIDDPISRRDALHGLINRLPDPNYALLRRLVLHLNAVQHHADRNRMNTHNLAICFGPTLMCNTNMNMGDNGWQVRAVDTILQNCYSIFDED